MTAPLRSLSWLVFAIGLGILGGEMGTFEPLWRSSSNLRAGPALSVASAAPRGTHDLSRLRVVHGALAPLAETYVQPDRIDPDRMYEAALDAVERLVPEVIFQRSGSQVVAQIGHDRSTLEVPPIRDLRALERELRVVATLLEERLDPEGVPPVDTSVDPFAAVEFAMGNGMLATLDPHSALLPPQQSREMDVENRGEFGGLGIHIEIRDDKLHVQQAVPGKPAARMGVRSGDHIRRIDGQSTINLTLDEAVELLRGPVGAPILLEVLHDGEAQPVEVAIRRANIKINEVEGYALAGGVAYIRMPSFHSTVHADLVSELKRLARDQPDGLRGLVLDLRDNPGGYLNQAIAVADTFLDEGEIVSTRGPHDRRPQTELARAAGTEDAYPIAVLVNANSASASEIVAGALRNNQRAVIVGERTFGKGSVQNLHALPYDSKLKVTIAHYLTPGERSIQSIGIPADVAVRPIFAGPHRVDGVMLSDALVHGRDQVQREADLDEHLERQDRENEEAMYVVPTLRTWGAPRGNVGPPDPGADAELAFALDLLHVSTRPFRGDMLSAAGPLARRWAERGEADVEQAMRALGLDWSPGPTPANPDLQISWSVGEDGFLEAGASTEVRVEVTNAGEAPVHRVVAVAREHERLDGTEFFLGRIDPGQTRSWSRRVRLEDGWPAEIAEVQLQLIDGQDIVLAEQRERVAVKPLPRPHIAWSWTVKADDGDVQVGDLVEVGLQVVNLGEGASRGVVARVRNRSGKALDVLEGTLRPGTLRDTRGEACAVPSEGGASPCLRILDPGARWEGVFRVRVLEALGAGYRLDLTVEDERTYDHAAIVQQGFYDYYGQDETIRFGLGAPPAGSGLHEPPRISLSRVPAALVQDELITVSGRVSDDEGLAHVLIFLDDDKIGYVGSRTGEVRPTLPFTATARIPPGHHTLTVLARDAEGFSTAQSQVVFRPPAAYQAQVTPRPAR